MTVLYITGAGVSGALLDAALLCGNGIGSFEIAFSKLERTLAELSGGGVACINQ